RAFVRYTDLEEAAMNRTRLAFAALIVSVSSLAVSLAEAQAPTPVRVRGTVEKLQGTDMTVRTANGQDMHIKLADNYGVMGVARATREDLGSGKYIGTTTVGERNGSLVALEVHIFPENM